MGVLYFCNTSCPPTSARILAVLHQKGSAGCLITPPPKQFLIIHGGYILVHKSQRNSTTCMLLEDPSRNIVALQAYAHTKGGSIYVYIPSPYKGGSTSLY